MAITSKLLNLKTSGYDWQSETGTARQNLARRLKHVSYIINLWIHAETADGYRKLPEHKKVLEFIQMLFLDESFFPANEFARADRAKILEELLASKKKLIPLDEIYEYVNDKPELAKNCFIDACLIAGVDGRIMTRESNFLQSLAEGLGIKEEESKKILSALNKNTKTKD